MTSRQRHPNRLKYLTALFLLPTFPAVVFAQQAPYYPGPQQPYYPGPQQQQSYDPGQQYQQPYAPAPPDYQQPQADYDQPQGYGSGVGYGQPQQLGPDQLDQLVAPIALNPDPLVALMLAASTYPAQVTQADEWRQSQGYASPGQIAYGANLQAWDPSVKALTAFPQVLTEMDRNMQWTAALGNAYYNEPQDVLQAIQIMRQRAQAAGNLQSNPEQEVSYDQGNIQLLPANPQVVYAPAYNPWTVYGQPVSPYPGFSLLGAIGSFLSSGFGSSAVQFGLGTVLSAFSGTPWGLLSWGLNWLTSNLLFHNSNYYSHSNTVADWGLRYGGPRAWMAPHREFASYNRGYNGYGRNYGRGYANNNRGFANNYNRGYQQNYNRSNYSRPGSAYGQNYRNGSYNRQQSAFANRANYGYSNRNQQGYGNRSEQAYNRPAYASGFADRSGRSGYSGYSGNSYGAYRGSSSNFGRGSSSEFNRSFSQESRSYSRGNSFLGSRSASYGGGHNYGSFGHEKSFKAPKYKAPKYKAPKMHGGGGGHHSGGGHSHGGGHHR